MKCISAYLIEAWPVNTDRIKGARFILKIDDWLHMMEIWCEATDDVVTLKARIGHTDIVVLSTLEPENNVAPLVCESDTMEHCTVFFNDMTLCVCLDSDRVSFYASEAEVTPTETYILYGAFHPDPAFIDVDEELATEE